MAQAQCKYQFEVKVGRFESAKGVSAQGRLAVLWTRGTKTAETSGAPAGGEGARDVVFDEVLQLICTLLRPPSAPEGAVFLEKLCSFSLVEHLVVGGLAGTRTLGKARGVDLAPYADGTPALPRPLQLELRKNGAQVGVLHLTLSCRSLAGASVAGGACSGSIGSWDDDELSEMESESECAPLSRTRGRHARAARLMHA